MKLHRTGMVESDSRKPWWTHHNIRSGWRSSKCSNSSDPPLPAKLSNKEFLPAIELSALLLNEVTGLSEFRHEFKAHFGYFRSQVPFNMILREIFEKFSPIFFSFGKNNSPKRKSRKVIYFPWNEIRWWNVNECRTVKILWLPDDVCEIIGGRKTEVGIINSDSGELAGVYGSKCVKIVVVRATICSRKWVICGCWIAPRL